MSALPLGPVAAEAKRAQWQRGQEGLSVRFTLREPLPPLLTQDNLAGHKRPAFVCWLMDHSIMSLYTPLVGSWPNMAESIQRKLVSGAPLGQCPSGPEQIIDLKPRADAFRLGRQTQR